MKKSTDAYYVDFDAVNDYWCVFNDITGKAVECCLTQEAAYAALAEILAKADVNCLDGFIIKLTY